jgi:hypothetical protein
VAELEREIKRRFGLSVDVKTLYRLASSGPVQRADLGIAAAAAAVLGVGLGELFDVQAVPIEDGADALDPEFRPEQSRRLAALFDFQSQRELTMAEQEELDALVSDYGQRLHERRLREIAVGRGISVEEARGEAAADLNQAVRWWQSFETDPSRRIALAKRTRGRAAQTAE